MTDKAYNLDDMEHKDCSFMDCTKLIKNGISEQFLEAKNFEWVDSEGYTCNTWRIVYKEEKTEVVGMTLEDAKKYIEERNKELLFGYDTNEFMKKQYK